MKNSFKHRKMKQIMLRFYENSGLETFNILVDDLVQNFDLELPCKTSVVKEWLWRKIALRLKTYNKYELYQLSEYIREFYCHKIISVEQSFRMSELNEVALYIQIIIISNENFGRNKLDDGIITLLELLKIYNITHINSILFSDIQCTNDLCKLLKPYQDSKINEFMDNVFAKQLLYEKLESYDIHDSCTRNYLKKKKKLPDQIRYRLHSQLHSKLMFNFADLELLVENLALLNGYYKNKNYNTHIRIQYDQFISLFNTIIPEANLKHLIEFFAINNYSNSEVDPRKIELKFFYKVDGYLEFGINELLETFTIYKNIIVSGHYKDYLNIEESLDIFSKSHNDLSKFFSYLVADLLSLNGYSIPRTESGIFMIDIPKIEVNSKRIVLNDVDVLALDHTKKELLNIELKVFKPSIDYKRLLNEEIPLDKIENVKARARLLKDNLDIVGEALYSMNIIDYTVKSILITSRPSFAAYSGRIEGIEYYTFNDAIELIQNHGL